MDLLENSIKLWNITAQKLSKHVNFDSKVQDSKKGSNSGHKKLKLERLKADV